MTAGAIEWLERFAEKLGVEPPTAPERDALLGLAGVAAHASERTAAPISCYLAARSGLALDQAVAAAKALAAEMGSEE